jgi:hypothetical protein
MVDRVIPIKREQAEYGGDGAEDVPYNAPADQNEDALSARGYYIQNDSSNDSNVIISRDASNNMTFADSVNGTKNLFQLSSHRTLIHFIDEGPGEEYVTGATKTITGTVFPTEILWKRADATNLVKQTITWTGPRPTVVEWKLYDTNGTTVLATVTDTVSYTGPFESSRSRSIS